MSHFTVLVIGNDVEGQLAPFHEFECTGQDDQYVQDIDTTDEERSNFQQSTVRRVRLSDGSIIDRYNAACYRDPTDEELKAIGPIGGMGFCKGLQYTSKDWGDGRGYRARVWQLPEGSEEVEERHASFADYLRWAHSDDFVVPHGEQPDLDDLHKYGFALQDESGEITKVIDRTNPKAKWDWWVVGGRWAGFFSLKSGATGERGENGLMGSCRSKSGVDQARKGDIDIEGMRTAAAKDAGEKYDQIHAVIAGREWIGWDECRKLNEGDINAAREQYSAQPVVLDVRKLDPFLDLDEFKASREDYTQAAAASAITTFAVLKDGQWHERGEMGWWASVSNEKSDWQAEFAALIDSLPDDTLLTVVDCHI